MVSFRISPSLDLQKLSSMLPDAKFNPEEAPALVMEFKQPRSVATLFSDGMVTLTGPKSMGDVEEIFKMVRDRLLVVGMLPVERPEVKVLSTTVSTDYGKKLNLKTLAKSLHIAAYHAKEFPGLVYQPHNPNTVILLFHSGKIVCTGVTWEEMKPSLDALMETFKTLGI